MVVGQFLLNRDDLSAKLISSISVFICALLFLPQPAVSSESQLVPNRRYEEMYFFLQPRYAGANTKVKPESEPFWQKRLVESNQSIEKSPFNAYLYQCRGDVNSALGEIDNTYNAKAYIDYTKAIILDPHHHDAYCFRGDLSANQGHYIEALSDYQAAMENAQYVSRAGYTRARLFGKLGQYKEANEAWSELIARSNDPQLLLERAHLRFIFKDYQLALEDCEKALLHEPFYNPAATYLQKALINCVLRHYDKAIEDCKKIIQADPLESQAYALQNLANRMLAGKKKPLGDIEKGEYAVLKQFLQTDYKVVLESCCKAGSTASPQEIDLVQMRADMFSAIRKDEEAKKCYETIVQARPKDYAAFRQLALTEYHLHEQGTAFKQAKQLLADDPGNTELTALVDLLSPKAGKCGGCGAVHSGPFVMSK